MSTAYAFPWEREAMNGEEMPDGLTQEEQLTFQSLAYLYARFGLKQISREQGHMEKGKILHELDVRTRRAEVEDRLAQWHTQLLKGIEDAATTYQKERTLENADRLVRTIYGLLPKEKELLICPSGEKPPTA